MSIKDELFGSHLVRYKPDVKLLTTNEQLRYAIESTCKLINKTHDHDVKNMLKGHLQSLLNAQRDRSAMLKDDSAHD